MRTRKHGTTSEYNNHGCRCDECRAACAVQMKEWRYRTGKTPRPVPFIILNAELFLGEKR